MSQQCRQKLLLIVYFLFKCNIFGQLEFHEGIELTSIQKQKYSFAGNSTLRQKKYEWQSQFGKMNRMMYLMSNYSEYTSRVKKNGSQIIGDSTIETSHDVIEPQTSFLLKKISSLEPEDMVIFEQELKNLLSEKIKTRREIANFLIYEIRLMESKALTSVELALESELENEQERSTNRVKYQQYSEKEQLMSIQIECKEIKRQIWQQNLHKKGLDLNLEWLKNLQENKNLKYMQLQQQRDSLRQQCVPKMLKAWSELEAKMQEFQNFMCKVEKAAKIRKQYKKKYPPLSRDDFIEDYFCKRQSFDPKHENYHYDFIPIPDQNLNYDDKNLYEAELIIEEQEEVQSEERAKNFPEEFNLSGEIKKKQIYEMFPSLKRRHSYYYEYQSKALAGIHLEKRSKSAAESQRLSDFMSKSMLPFHFYRMINYEKRITSVMKKNSNDLKDNNNKFGIKVTNKHITGKRAFTQLENEIFNMYDQYDRHLTVKRMKELRNEGQDNYKVGISSQQELIEQKFVNQVQKEEEEKVEVRISSEIVHDKAEESVQIGKIEHKEEQKSVQKQKEKQEQKEKQKQKSEDSKQNVGEERKSSDEEFQDLKETSNCSQEQKKQQQTPTNKNSNDKLGDFSFLHKNLKEKYEETHQCMKEIQSDIISIGEQNIPQLSERISEYYSKKNKMMMIPAEVTSQNIMSEMQKNVESIDYLFQLRKDIREHRNLLLASALAKQ